MKNYFILKSAAAISGIINCIALVTCLAVLIGSIVEATAGSISKEVGKTQTDYTLFICFIFIGCSAFNLFHISDEVKLSIAMDNDKTMLIPKNLKKMFLKSIIHFISFSYPIYYFSYIALGGSNIVFFYLAIFCGASMCVYTLTLLFGRWKVAMG